MTKRNKQKKEVQDVNAFMHEVEEAMHAEQLSHFWKTYRVGIIGVVVLAFAGFSGFKYYQSSSEKSFLNEANAFYAVEKNADVSVDDYADLTTSNAQGVALLARFSQVKEAIAKGKRQEAMLILDDVMLNQNLPEEYRQLAQIYKAEIAMTEDVDLARTTLEDLVNGGTIYMSSALEILGYIYEKQGELKRAHAMYEQIVNMGGKAASGAAKRAQQRLNAIGPIMVEATPEAVQKS